MARFARLLSVAPLLTMLGAALPVQAAPLDQQGFPAADHLSILRDAGVANGWDRDRYRYRHRYRHGRYDDGFGIGDVITGIVLIGGAVAIANAISDNDDDRERYRDPYPNHYPRNANTYPDDRYVPDRAHDSQAEMQGAIDRCISGVEREDRVASVDVASRVLNGWTIEGALRGGGLYRCEIDSFGDIRDIRIDGQGFSSWDRDTRQPSSYGREDDDYYTQARARQGMGAPDARSSDARAIDDWTSDSGTRDWQRGETDDRYETTGDAVIASAR